MPLRLKWYGFPTPPELLRKLGRAMLTEQYRPGLATGFQVAVARRDELAGRFIQRREFIEEVVDPFGERLTIPRVEFRQVAFRLSSHADLIEVADPSRDARLLFERLASFGGPIVRPSPLALDVRLWVRHLELRHGPAKVLAARLSDLALSTTAAASVVIKGTQDVRSHLEDLLRGRHGTVDRVQLEFKHRLGQVSIELTRDARAVVHEGGEAAGALAAEALSAVTNAAAGGVKQA